MTDVHAGDEITRDHWPPARAARSTTAIDNVTSTAFTPGSPVVELTFTAPSSGRVAVCVQAGIDQDDAGNRLFVTYEMYQGTSSAGTLVQAARESYGVSSHGSPASNDLIWGNMSIVHNLTPGATHYARMMHRTEAGTTNDVTFRELIVFPVP